MTVRAGDGTLEWGWVEGSRETEGKLVEGAHKWEGKSERVTRWKERTKSGRLNVYVARTCASEDRGGTMIYNSRLGESNGDDERGETGRTGVGGSGGGGVRRIELCGMETKRRRGKVLARGGFRSASERRGEERREGTAVKGIRIRCEGASSFAREGREEDGQKERKGMSRDCGGCREGRPWKRGTGERGEKERIRGC